MKNKLACPYCDSNKVQLRVEACKELIGSLSVEYTRYEYSCDSCTEYFSNPHTSKLTEQSKSSEQREAEDRIWLSKMQEDSIAKFKLSYPNGAKIEEGVFLM
jgi:Zn finger protein HypA/HybF involved in hydrogenase expression